MNLPRPPAPPASIIAKLTDAERHALWEWALRYGQQCARQHTVQHFEGQMQKKVEAPDELA